VSSGLQVLYDVSHNEMYDHFTFSNRGKVYVVRTRAEI